MTADAHNHLHELARPSLAGTGIDLASACGTSPADWRQVLDLAARDPRIAPAIGLHPWLICPGWEAHLDQLDQWIAAHPDAAVGEVGLDRTRRSPGFDVQVPALERQLAIAVTYSRPVVLHCVRAWGRLCELLESSPAPARGLLLHSYAGPADLLPRFAALGARFSFSSPPARELLDTVPRDRLLTESDATATNGRSPAHAAEVADKIAERLGEEPGALREVMAENFRVLFGR